MCPTIGSTSSMPRATICRPHHIPLTAVAQPNNMPVLANIYQFLLSLVCLQSQSSVFGNTQKKVGHGF